MTFGEKLIQLRKDRKMSQEVLAEKLNTSRQAISKWENNQGYPEAEKIITLASIFEVSTDYLLKHTEETANTSSEGLYVSREKAESWLSYERSSTMKTGFGMVFLLLIRVPFLIFPDNSSSALWIVGLALAVIGIGILVSVCLSDRDFEYRELKRNSLIFDNHYMDELQGRYRLMEKKYHFMIIVSMIAILFGAVGIVVFREGTTVFNIYSTVYTVVVILAIYVLIYSFSMMSAYELLTENKKYVSGMLYRIRNRRK